MDPSKDDTPMKRPGLLVIGAGLITSALSMGLVFLIGVLTDGFEIMGFYLNYIIPVGAIGVGLVAGSGYGAVSWLTGVKISKGLLWTIVALQIAAYFAAQYVQFSRLHPCYPDGRPLSFFQYYDLIARLFAWQQKDGTAGQPLGAWGYAFRALEVIGFTIGGLIVPAILFKAPYCRKCQIYMKSRHLCLIPAGVEPKKLKKKDVEGQAAYQAEMERAAAEGENIVSQVRQLAEGGRADEFCKLVELLAKRKKETAKLFCRISLGLVSCRQCFDGYLGLATLTGQGDKIQSARREPIPLNDQFVCRTLQQRKAG